jgi:hypothetical protein
MSHVTWLNTQPATHPSDHIRQQQKPTKTPAKHLPKTKKTTKAKTQRNPTQK